MRFFRVADGVDLLAALRKCRAIRATARTRDAPLIGLIGVDDSCEALQLHVAGTLHIKHREAVHADALSWVSVSVGKVDSDLPSALGATGLDPPAQ